MLQKTGIWLASWLFLGLASLASGQTKNVPDKAVVKGADPLPDGAIARIGTVRFRHSDTVCSLAFSADGTRITSAALASASVWDALTGRPLAFLSLPWQHVTPTVSPHGTLVAYALDNQAVRVCDALTGKERCTLPSHKGNIHGLAFSKDDRWLASADGQGGVFLWDVAAGKLARHWKPPSDEHGLGRCHNVFTPDGNMLVNASEHGSIVIWDVKTGDQRIHIKPRKENFGLYGLTVSGDGQMLATVCAAGQRIELWRVKTGEFVREISTKKNMVGPAFSPDGQYLVWWSGELCFWDLAKETITRRLPGPKCVAWGATFSPNGKYLAAGGDDHAVHLWDLATGKEMFPTGDGFGGSVAVNFLADGKTLLARRAWPPVRDPGARLMFWDLNGNALRQTTFDATKIRAFDVSPDGGTMALAEHDGSVRLRDLASGNDLLKLEKLPGEVLIVKFSPQGEFLLIGYLDNAAGLRFSENLQVWKRTSKTTLEKKAEINGWRCHCAPDNQWVGAWSLPGYRFLKWDTGQTVRYYPKLSGTVSAALPSGRILVVTSAYAKPPNLVELATGTPIRKLECADAMRMDSFPFAVSPDGRTVSAGLDSGTIILWDVCSGKQVGKFAGHRGAIHSLCFSPDGRTLVSGGADTTILIWDCAKIIPTSTVGPTDLTPKELEQNWQDLMTNDAEHGYRAVTALVRAKAKAVSFLKTKIKPTTSEDHRQINHWIDEIGKENFQVRTKAMAELEKMGELAEPVLRQTLSRPLPLETKRRINQILENLADRSPPSSWLRTLRTLETLELIGSPEARKLVDDLSRGLRESRQTQEAILALERLDTQVSKR